MFVESSGFTTLLTFIWVPVAFVYLIYDVIRRLKNNRKK